LPGVRFVCFSDTEVPCERIHLVHKFPGWWSKLELGRTLSLHGDLLYLDLDTVLVGDCSVLLKPTAAFALTDVYGNGNLQSSVMFLTEADREKLWEEWMRNPCAHMARIAGAGDQGFIQEALPNWCSWQKALPGVFVSYKADMRSKGLTQPPEGSRVVVFHGRPRPWQVEANWIPRIPCLIPSALPA
jgi:hypothetical protein